MKKFLAWVLSVMMIFTTLPGIALPAFAADDGTTTYTVSVSADPTEGGTVTGDGTYAAGETVTLIATANPGYSFWVWMENDEVVELPGFAMYSFIVEEDRSLTAYFTKTGCTVSVSANPTEGGTVSGGGMVDIATSVTVTAEAKDGYKFTGWTENGNEVSEEASYTFTAYEDRNLVANFEKAGNPCVEEDCTGTYDNGFCTVCRGYQPANLTTNVYDVNGDNTKDEVYEIANAGQLYWFADKINNDYDNYYNANAILTDNITVNENLMDKITINEEDGTATVKTGETVRAWTPIGNDDNNYTGIFDGNGKTISGLYCNDSSVSYVGLFGWVDQNGTVKNVTVANSYFCGSVNVGGVVGLNSKGSVKNCYNTGTVSGNTYVGGVAGENNGTGWFIGTIKNCYNTGSVIGVDYVGGVVGLNGFGNVTNCYYLDIVGDTTNPGGINGSDVTGQAVARTAAQFASGEVTYLLQSGVAEVDGVTPEIWGQTIGNETYPVLGGMKVYLVRDKYTNDITFEIVSHGSDGNKATATVTIPTAGTYTVIFADYEGGKPNELDTVTVTADGPKAVTVTSDVDISLGTGDKIMLWGSMTNLAPKCDAYIVE